jgi:hypothetical protein
VRQIFDEMRCTSNEERAGEAAKPRIGAGGLFDQSGDSTGVGDIDSVAAKHLNDGGAGRFAINCCAGNGIILSSRTTAAQKDKKRGLPSVQSLE